MIFTTFYLLALPLLSLAAPTPAPVPNPTRYNTQVRGRSVAISKRTNHQLYRTDGTANIPFLIAHRKFAVAKAHKGAKTFRKNTGARLASARLAEQRRKNRKNKRQDSSLPPSSAIPGTGQNALVDDAGALWHGTISVGTPPVEYKVDFDTGSSDIFLPSANCTTNCAGHLPYSAANSSTSSSLGIPFQLQYGDGSTVSGSQFTDVVSISNLTVSNQTLGAADTYSDGFNSTNFPPDGLMGMAFQQISEYNAPPLFQSLVAANQTAQPVFAFKLAQTGSELFIGGTNSALFTGNFSWAAVTEEGYWQVSMDSVSASGNTTSSNAPGLNATASIIDTGTTLVLAPTEDATQFYATIPGAKDASTTVGAGFFTVPCDTIPVVSLSFGSTPFPISTQTFNLGAVSTGSTECVGGIVGADIADIGWIVGDVFLQNVYTAFDFGNKRVGFATLANASQA